MLKQVNERRARRRVERVRDIDLHNVDLDGVDTDQAGTDQAGTDEPHSNNNGVHDGSMDKNESSPSTSCLHPRQGSMVRFVPWGTDAFVLRWKCGVCQAEDLADGDMGGDRETVSYDHLSPDTCLTYRPTRTSTLHTR